MNEVMKDDYRGLMMIKEIAERIFRAYDIRGIWEKDINEEVGRRIGKAIGTFIDSGNICVGFDSRFSSPRLSKSIINGLLSCGCKVFEIGFVPNPVCYFYAWKEKIHGCYITASHNPMNWNGVKLILSNGTSYIEELGEVKEIFKSGDFKEGEGSVKETDALTEYKEFLKKKFKKVRGRVAIEFFGGAATAAKDMFNEMGIEIIAIHGEPRGDFYGISRPEPKGENLKELKNVIKKSDVLFGVAYDGDADRSVFVDDNGNETNGSIMCWTFLSYILKKRKGKVVITADCASELEGLVSSFGSELIWWRVGHGFIERKCVETKALFAGEQSSHFYFNEFYPFSDGLLATAYLVKILNEYGKKLSEVLEDVKIHPVEKMYVNVGNDEMKGEIVNNLRKKFQNVIDLMDGFRIKLNETEWVLIRASQTNPEVNICIEARDEERMKELIEKFRRMVEEEKKKLEK